MNRITISSLILGASLAAVAGAQDVAVSKVGGGNDYTYYGQTGGIAAYSIATTSCNVGNVVINWTPGNGQAPAISTEMWGAHADGRFTQLGYSFLKDSFCAVSEPSCGSCQGTPCSTLGIGCADTYWSGLNDGAGGVSKWQLDPTVGTWPSGGWSGPSGPLPIRGRLQVDVNEIDQPGWTYFSSSTYISEHDQINGNGENNSSYQEFRFNSLSSISNLGAINMFEPAIYAWQEVHPDVHISQIVNDDEGGAGIDSWIYVGSKATDIGGGAYRYDYAVYNFNSKQAVSSFSLDSGCVPSNFEFDHPEYHSGSPWSNAAWNQSTTGSTVAWTSPDTHASNPNGAAIRWGMMYTFHFEAFAAPAANLGTANMDLFAPGSASSISGEVIVPGDDCCSGGSISNYCSANANSVAANGAIISANGTPEVGANDISFSISALPLNQFGYFLMSQSQGFVANFGGSSGNLCLGAPQIRFSGDVLNSGAFGFTDFDLDNTDLPQNTTFMGGDSWNFQMWYRDGLTSNTTEGVNITFCQ